MVNRFDELAKDLARGISRREALRRFGGGVAGALLASLSLGRAWGDPGGNSDCAHFCDSVYPPGPLRGQCKSDAAHGQGLCLACGADVSRVCGTSSQDLTCCLNTPVSTCCSGQCTDLTSNPQHCGSCSNVCPATAPYCVGGQCTTQQCARNSNCPSGQVCLSGTCVAASSTCSNPSTCIPSETVNRGCSSNNPFCYCVTAVEGGTACVSGGACLAAFQAPCTSNADCEQRFGPGLVCVELPGCCNTACLAACP